MIPTEFEFITNVGSHMWGMEREDSDRDLFAVYVVPTMDIFRGTAKFDSYQKKYVETNTEYSIHEIGKVIDMVLKGNVNFLWGTLSPIIVDDEYGLLRGSLKPLVTKSLSKNCAKSIYGMSKHNYERYIRDNMGQKDVRGELLTKKANTIVRTIKFGVRILEGKGPSFEPVYNQTMDDVKDWMEVLKDAEKVSNLPDTPTNEDALRDLLAMVRRQNMPGRTTQAYPKDWTAADLDMRDHLGLSL